MAAEKALLAQQTWVQCDKCSSWRKIPTSLAESLAEDVPWYCIHNPDPAHNSCDTPQELTDAEIDRLHVENDKGQEGGGTAAGGGGAAALASVPRRHRRPPVWQLITSNNYAHRERKEQDEDDIMICQCKKVWATDHSSVGCGPECLNRMLNIECVEEYCPSGHRCSNQMFTKREYSKLDVLRAGAKGFGLFAAQDMKAGQFVIEYLGEVLEEEEYHRRKEYFIETGQRHYYFMNIGNGEVIDASRRGNLGRFINHSCEPNCETQKWVVHGELAIGLFTLDDIPAGTELTFDYNFERYGDKPMKCLCASKNCRGVIGGTQDKEGSTATRAAIAAAVEPQEWEQDPDFIMVTEKEHDASLNAILDRVVGLGWEKGWTPKLSQRLNKLASQHNVDLSNLSDDEDDEGAGGGADLAAASSGLSDAAEEEEEEALPAARKQARKQARKPAGKKGQKAAAAAAAGVKARKQPRQRKAVVSEDEWDAAAESPSTEGSSDEAGSDADEAPAPREPTSGARPRSARSGGSSEEGSDDDEAWRRAGRAGSGVAQQSAGKAGSLAANGTQVPFRKRLKRFARAAAAAEAASTTPAGSTGSRPRLGSGTATGTASKAATQSVASSTPAAGGSALIIPKRSSLTPMTAFSDRLGIAKRRSEIDRRLDELVNAAGRLRETQSDVIIRVLRLFNLCEIGPTVSKMGQSGGVDWDDMAGPPRPPSGGPQRSDGSGATGSASDLRALRPISRNESGSSLAQQAAAAAALQAAATAALQQQAAALGGAGAGAAGAGQREEGEVSPEPHAGEQRSQQQHHHLQPPAGLPLAPQGGSSPGKAEREREQRERRAEASSRIRAAWDEAQRSGQLSARQSARIADMSLLLDVVLKTNTLSAKKDFVKCGLLRQLLGVVGGNTGKQYGVILKKVLRVVESLPLTADDMHHTRSAHGSFADLVRELAQSTDFEIRSKAYGLLKKFPVQNCTRPVAPDAMHSCAGSSRSGRGPPPLTPGNGGGLPPTPGQQWRDGPLPPLAAPPPPPGAGLFGGPPPPGHFHPSPHQPHDGWRPRDHMPPSRFGPGRLPPGGPMGPGRPGPPMMGRPPPPGMPPPHHFQQQPPPFYPGEAGPPPHQHQHQHPSLGRPPPPPPPPLSMPPHPGGQPDSGSGRKRTRWDQPGVGPGGPPAAGAAAAAEGPPPGSRVPPGFGGGSGWQRPPTGAQQEEPPSKRQAAGTDGKPNGVHAAGPYTSPPLLEPAPSWDVESQFALGTAGASYVGSAGGASGGTLSPESGLPRGTSHTYSPVASPGRQQGASGGLAGTGAGAGAAAPGRPLSAAYSRGSSGSGAAAGGGGEPAGNGNGSGGGEGGMHLSPMSDDDALPSAYGAGDRPGAQGQQQGGQQQGQGQQEAGADGHADSWDEPNLAFSAFVAETVRRRVGKYAQPDHPMCISQDEAGQLYSKIRREIVAKEQQAYDHRQATGQFKTIEKGKLEIKIREFVRDSIRRYHERRGITF